MKTTHTLAIAASAILLSVAAVTYAHPTGGMGPGMMGSGMMGNGAGPAMMGGGMGPGMMGGGMGPGMMSAEQMTTHLATLKAALKLKPDQEAAWTTLSDAMTGQMAAMQGMHTQMNADTGTTTLPDRMAQHSSFMQAGLAQMQAMRDTMSSFYAQLSAEQKTVLDKFMPMAQGGRPMARR